MCINASANVNDLKMQFLLLKVFIQPRKMKYLPDNVSCRKANIAGESVLQYIQIMRKDCNCKAATAH